MTQLIAQEIIRLERAALDRWGAGDPSGFLALCAPEVSYFDPFLEHRLDGLTALTQWYEGLRGQIHVDHYDMLSPHVVVGGDMAVLSFELVSHMGANQMRWNCTEVYRKDPAGWRLVHTHWSITGHMCQQTSEEQA